MKKRILICALAYLASAHFSGIKACERENSGTEDKIMTGKLDQDTQLTTASGCTFTVEKGWEVSQYDDITTLKEPAGELTVTLVENNEKTAEEAIAAAWKKIQPDFARAIQFNVPGVASDGWDEIVQCAYDTTTQESLLVFAFARRFGSIWYIGLVEGTKAAADRRGAGLGLIASSFKTPGLQEESFAGKKAHELNQAQLKEFMTFVEDARKQCEVPGAAIGIIQNGKIILAQGLGVRELGKDEAVTPETLFMIGSTTKSLTTLMMARLIDEGKFAWDTPVRSLMPEFLLGDEAITKQLCMKHMVSASTGMPRQDAELMFNFDCATPELRIAEMREMKPTTGFGETFQYSNSMVSASGYIAAHAADKSKKLGDAYNSAMQSQVFDPVGMKSTTFDFKEVVKHDHAAPHNCNLKFTYMPMTVSDECWVESIRPAGGAWSNVIDMVKYMLVELNKGVTAEGKRIISEENLLKRRETQIKIADKLSYGLGLMMEDDHGVLSIGHGGNTTGFTTSMFFLPEHNIGLVVLTNVRMANSFTGIVQRKFMELLFDGKNLAQELLKNNVEQTKSIRAKYLEDIVFEPEAAWLKQFVGTYTHPTLGNMVVRECADGFECDARVWKTKLGQKKEHDGTCKLIFTEVPLAGLTLLPQEEDGRMRLILEIGQHKYTFERVN